MADDPASRSTRTDELWAETRIDPIEIALPGGVGYTLRAYRQSDEFAERTDTDEAHVDDFDAAAAMVFAGRRTAHTDDDADDDAEPVSASRAANRTDPEDDVDSEDDEESETAEDDEESNDEVSPEIESEEVPVFLGHCGRVYLFRTPEKLVEFVKSGAEHDLSQVDTWPTVVDKITAADITPTDDDSYELDLVVENLRGGNDTWDHALLVKAGEVARDLGFALRLSAVRAALAPGSPLDDLDEALRAAEAGGVGGFLARRRLRKVPAQQSALGWRTIIGKISGASDWRD